MVDIKPPQLLLVPPLVDIKLPPQLLLVPPIVAHIKLPPRLLLVPPIVAHIEAPRVQVQYASNQDKDTAEENSCDVWMCVLASNTEEADTGEYAGSIPAGCPHIELAIPSLYGWCGIFSFLVTASRYTAPSLVSLTAS